MADEASYCLDIQTGMLSLSWLYIMSSRDGVGSDTVSVFLIGYGGVCPGVRHSQSPDTGSGSFFDA